MIRNTLSRIKLATFCIELPDSNKHGMHAPIGTGFFVSDDGWFVTAAHVVLDEHNKERNGIDKITLHKEWNSDYLPVSCSYTSLEYIDPNHDFALLKSDFSRNKNKAWLENKDSFPYITISSRLLDEGEPVYSFGYPLSDSRVDKQPHLTISEIRLSPRTTSAIVSSTLENTKMTMSSDDEKVYVLDKALNYGNSGGPIIASETGNVHAICSRFQPVVLPQPHLVNANGEMLSIRTPSLYGVVLSLNNPSILQAVRDRNIPIITS